MDPAVNSVLSLQSTSVVSLQIGLYSISFGFSWGPVGWLVPSEIHDLNTRSAGQSITVFVQLVSGATVTQSESAALSPLICALQTNGYPAQVQAC